MRFVHVTCVLLATAICCNAAAIQGDANSTNQQAVDTVDKTTLAKYSPTTTVVVPANASVTVANAIAKNATDNTTTTVASATTVSTNANDKKDNVTSANEQSTTASPATSTTATSTSAPTTLSTTTKKTPIPENCTSTTVTTPTTSNASVSSTTAVPVSSTKVAPPSPYKERRFDGLSFLGGIILATCLTAIGVLSWKFYKTVNEQNYRTL